MAGQYYFNFIYFDTFKNLFNSYDKMYRRKFKVFLEQIE